MIWIASLEICSWGIKHLDTLYPIEGSSATFWSRMFGIQSQAVTFVRVQLPQVRMLITCPNMTLAVE